MPLSLHLIRLPQIIIGADSKEPLHRNAELGFRNGQCAALHVIAISGQSLLGANSPASGVVHPAESWRMLPWDHFHYHRSAAAYQMGRITPDFPCLSPGSRNNFARAKTMAYSGVLFRPHPPKIGFQLPAVCHCFFCEVVWRDPLSNRKAMIAASNGFLG